MSVFDKVQSYSSGGLGGTSSKAVKVDTKIFNSVSGLPFDITTPSGYFLNRVCQEGFVMDELEGVLKETGDQLVISGAGSGKTSGLIFKIMYDIITGQATKILTPPGGQPIRVTDSILVSTFLASGAEELKTRAKYWQRKFGYTMSVDSISFCTLHAEFKRTLNAMGIATNMLASRDASQLLKAEVSKLGLMRDDKYPLTNEDYRTIESIVAYSRNRLDDKRFNHPSCIDYGLTPSVLQALINMFKESRRASGKLDFEDLQEVLLGALQQNPAVRDFVANRYNYIYLDEFQDTSQIQYEIIKYYAVGRKKIVAIGDDDQLIYSWRGSDIEIINYKFEKDFSPKVYNLSYNYRCPSEILNPVLKSIVCNTERHPKQLRASAEGGELNCLGYSSLKYMLNGLLDSVKVDLTQGYRSAVLCRTNFDGMIPAFLLEMNRVCDFSISSSNMTLDSALPKKILGVTSLFTDRSTPAVRSTLEMLVPKYDRWKINDFVSTCRATGCSVFTVPLGDIGHSIPDLEDVVTNLREFRDTNNDIGGLKYLLSYISFFAFGGDSAYCKGARAYIETLLFLLDSKEFSDVSSFRESVDEINVRLRARIGKDNVAVKISTVHECKGKEWDSVYIWNNSEGVFPSSKTDEEDILQYEEERRVHYIAWTRARKKLTVLALRGFESPFLKETGVTISSPVNATGSFKKSKLEDTVVEETDALVKALGY